MSAADLQRRHAELEGAPDPFPSLQDTPVKARPAAPSNGTPDTDSVDAFPSLASSSPAAAKAPVSAWSAPRIKATVSKQPTFSDSFTIPVGDLSTAGKDGRPTSLGEIMRQVMAQHKVKLDASTNQKLRQTTFYLKSENKRDFEKAKKALLAGLSPVVTLVLNAPASTIPSIIGPKGATLKEVREQTGVRVDIPRRDALNGQANGGSHSPSRNATPLPGTNDEDEEPTVPVTITGPQPLALEAQEMLQQIISSKTSRTTQRVKDIPAHILPFLLPQRAKFLEAAQGGDVQLQLNSAAREIAVSGDREAVERVIESIKSARDHFLTEVTSVKLMLPKRQHRLLTGKGADEIMTKSKCAVIVQSFEEPGEEVNVYGRAADIGNGVTAVMEKANSAYIHEFPLPGPIAVSRQLLTYMTRVGYPKTLSEANPGVAVYTPPLSTIQKATVLNVDLIGEKPTVDATVRQLSQLLGKLIGATKDVPIDWLVHRIINSHKNAKKLKAFHEQQNVLVFFPPESAEQSNVLLVYDPTSPNASPSPVEKAQKLEEVEEELLKMAKAAADVKTQTITVEKKWHEAVIGHGGTTLNAIIGEDKTLSIKLGKDAGDATEDVIVVRGISADVNRAVKEIEQIVEAAKNDEIVNSYSTEFEIGREFVARIVGAQGAGVNRIRDSLGVKVDFSDDHEDKDKDAAKKKKIPAGQKVKVKITGRKENVEEAKRRITGQADKFADETTEVLKIPRQFHPSLIGSGGKYVVRLEDKYDVKITFPRGGDAAESTDARRDVPKPDEVIVKGPKKGVSQAKAELLEAYDFEKESNNQVKFTVPTRSVARILGRGGAQINEIKDITGAQIDIDKSQENSEVSGVVLRGTKAAIAEAKERILEISNQVQEETTDSISIEHKFHRTIIGPGGSGLKELISRCGGPSDPKTQAGLIRFPRHGEESDEVTLRGEPKLVAKVKAELEKVAADLRDRVVLGVDIPAAQHRALIGRGGQHLNELQKRTNTQVQFPGSRSYGNVGEPENADELANTDPADLVKVTGPRAACEQAVAELKAAVKPPAPEGVTDTLSVPLKYHHAVTQQGNLFRTLRNFGVSVEQSAAPKNPPVPPRPTAEGAISARIDDLDENTASVEAQWQVVPNYQDVEEGEAVWTFKAADQAALDKALGAVRDALAHAEEMTHVGFLTLPDRSMFPRIVGAKGSNVARLRAESKADITVSRDDNTIVIIGSETAIETAKDLILKMTAGRPPRGGRRD
ncbi:Vigilin 1 [Phanerochaete sordida]|uniref:Vigilin 1 n=1 Tax=Phanerochaete sordida TaxID=48140 RepID=A0A9P3GED5_9APHY|nr:Vigilin 1 [Phanerochaete sordida]